jgi:putative transposase
VKLDVPRDRDGSFEPQLVKKRQRRLHGVDEMIISLTAKGLTTGEVQAHLAEVYGTQVSRETISKVTDAIIEEMNDWLNRPLEQVYAAVFIDAIVVKVRDGQVTNRPAYTAIGVTADGTRDILGIWIGDGGEGAKFWLQVLTEIKNRGTEDVCIVVCDGLKGLPDAIEADLAARDHPDVCAAPDPQHLPVCLPCGLGQDGPRPAAGLHRPVRAGRQGTAR